ncbi:MAG TPA: hypothetical protein VFN53_06080, partial [Acidobacteriaceae bacterium]|nr:hypothetical protein [Acidobacteriaceae bacterium]
AIGLLPMEHSLASKALADELWTSLSSLLRSHIAMHSIAQPGHALRVLSSSTSEVVVLGPWGKLHVVGPNRTGMCATEFRPENVELGDEYETFGFSDDGMIRFQNLGTGMDMEAAVEYLLRKVQA